MQYRIHPKTGDKISVIGIGTGPIFEAPEKEAVTALTYAYEQGINYADFATAGAKTFSYAGKAFGSIRGEMLYQIHFGANYETGEYGWITDLDTVKRQVDWQLKELKTDYIDFGMIHCLDTAGDWEQYRQNGVLGYLLEMKKAGVVRHIGLSTHTPELANIVLDTGLVEQLMFSINPAYDYQQGEFANGSAGERMALYRRCEAEGMGISVMKPYSGGQMLDAGTSPFGHALTACQCIQYALDKPGVLTVLPGIRGLQDVKDALGVLTASEEKRDYSAIGAFTPKDAFGTCVYCNHCRPCPAGLNINLSTNITIWPKSGTAWRRITMRSFRNTPPTASAAGIATEDALPSGAVRPDAGDRRLFREMKMQARRGCRVHSRFWPFR